MSEGDRRPDADVGTAGTLPGVVAAANAPQMAATQASIAVDAIGDTLGVDAPHAPTLPGPHTVADLPALSRVDDTAYSIGVEIARGGMGKILSARDRRLRRDVVIKVTRHDSGRIDPRFEREALITARLQHPSIVRVYEAGVLGDGRAFYAMERVRGRSLEVVLDDKKNLRERLALLPHAIAVAEAIAYAHNEGVLHRDLKPSNVLLGPFGETVVIDWGLAKDLRAVEATVPTRLPSEPTSSSDSSLTQDGSVMGTPSYMAPEQARGEPADERSDIYALGALLYTILAGVPAHRGRTTEEVLDQVMSGTLVPITEREPAVPPELATIVERAMAHAPRDRYQTAKELADELRQFAAGKLVASHQYSAWRLIKRWIARHRITVGVSAFALVTLAIVGVVAIRNIVEARERAIEAHNLSKIDEARAERRTNDLVIDLAKAVIKTDPSSAAAWILELSDEALDWPKTHELAVAASAQGLARELVHDADAEFVVLLRDGKRFVTASDDGAVRLWDLATEKAIAMPDGHVGPIEAIELSPDGMTIATAGTDKTVRLWNLVTNTTTVRAEHGGTVRDLAFSPDGSQLVSTGEDGTLWLWSVTGPDKVKLGTHTHGYRPVVWTRDGVVIAGGFDGKLGWYNPTTRRGAMKPGPGVEVRCLALSPDGTKLVVGDENGKVTLWSMTGTLIRELGTHTDVVRDLAFTPDGKRVISVGGDKHVFVHLLAGGPPSELEGNLDGIKDVEVSPDGTRVATAGVDGVARIWPIEGGPPRELRGHGSEVKGVAFVPDGRFLTVGEDNRARVWRLDLGTPPTGIALRAWLSKLTNIAVRKPKAPG